MIVTTAQMAAILSVSKSRLNELARKGKVPRGPGPDQWDAEAVQSAISGNLDIHQISPARGEAPPNVIGRRPGDPPVSTERKGEAAPPPAYRGHREPEPPPKGSIAHAQLMDAQASAAIKAMKAQEMEGRLIDRAGVESERVETGGKYRDAVMGLTSRVCNRLPAEWRRELSAVLDDEIRRMLTALSDEIRSAPQVA